MSVYEFRLRPLAAWSTPWYADTLWGSLCWAWLESGGRTELTNLLARFNAMKPPFVISDALPADLLPFPIGVKVASQEAGKKIKSDWCSTADFQKWSTGELKELPVPVERQRPFCTRGRLHVRRNRNTDAGEDGGLFEEDEHSFNTDAFPNIDSQFLSIFVRLLPENNDQKQEAALLHALQTCFEILGQKGYGRKASTGLGAFDLEGSPRRHPWLEVKLGQTGFVSLSSFVPAREDPREGRWKVHARNPKFASNLVPQFLKGNLITLTAGSNFRAAGTLREFYGRMIEVPRTGFEGALHYGLSFVAPCAWPE